VSFGLVAIPVKLYTATQSANAISFNLLHKTDGSRLKQQYVCQKEGVVVERDEMVKGYEFAKDQYVMFFARRDQGAGGSWNALREISEFVSDRVDRSGLLRQDLLPGADKRRSQSPTPCSPRRSGRPGAAASAAGPRAGKGYLVILRPIGDVLAMQQLHYAADVRRATEVDVPKPEVKPRS